MVVILGGMIIYAIIFLGVGLLVITPKDQNTITTDDCFRSFWMGLVISISFLQIWHLFFPINLTVFFIHCFGAASGFVLRRKNISGFVRKLTWRKILPTLGASLFLALLVSFFSIDGNLHFDHGLYHLQTVLWLENYAIVPGLGNVHHRLAFNNSSFLYVALINKGFFSGYSYYISNSLLAWVITLQSLQSISALINEKTIISKKTLYYAIVFPFFIWHIKNFYFAGYSPDLFISVLQVLIAGEFISLMEKDAKDQVGIRLTATQLLVLCLLMVCVKLSGLVYALTFLIATLIIFLKKRQPNISDQRFFINRLVSSLVIGIPWLIRSVILSGYLVYPSSLISFNVLWKIPKTMVDPIASVIYNWSRYGNSISPDTPFAEWLPQWLWTVPRGLKEAWILAVPLAIILIAIFTFRRFSIKQHLGQILVILFAVSHIVYWFLLAPEIRFMGMSFWVAFGALLIIFIDWIDLSYTEISTKGVTLLVLFFVLLWLSPSIPQDFGVKRNLIKPPSEYKISSEFVSKEVLVTRTTTSGLTVYLANDYSQQCCWDLPLPCTRTADYYGKLALIDPSNMQKGFYIKYDE
jgi:hypothetical protein